MYISERSYYRIVAGGYTTIRFVPEMTIFHGFLN
jgi:hypothetical protein